MAKLTEKQKRFANYYIECGNASEAYRKAGYKDYSSSGVEANKSLNIPKIKEYIDKIIKSKDNERIASQDEVLEYFTNLMRGNLEEEVIISGESGIQKLIKGTDIKDRTQGAKELAKRYGLDKVMKEISDKNIEIEMVDIDED